VPVKRLLHELLDTIAADQLTGAILDDGPPCCPVAAYCRSMSSTRPFPPPWSIEEVNDACFIVRDHAGQALAYVYFEEESGRRSAAHLLPCPERWGQQ
jgi:hypothetical protein